MPVTKWLQSARRRTGGPDNPAGEALHLLELRAELQQQKIGTRLLERRDTLAHLFGGPDEPGSQAAVRDRVLFERHPLLELGVGQPVAVILVPGRARFYIGDTGNFVACFS